MCQAHPESFNALLVVKLLRNFMGKLHMLLLAAMQWHFSGGFALARATWSLYSGARMMCKQASTLFILMRLN